jgi:endonuclease/exonuclease/phosphatase family metal-dependent hydrolase
MKILSLNINWDNDKTGSWSRRCARIARSIHWIDPDVVLLQAVRLYRMSGNSQVDEITRMTPGYKYSVYCGAPRNEFASDGTAILSKVPISDPGHIVLQHHPANVEDPQPRALQYATIPLDGKCLHIFNCYLSWVEMQNDLNVAEAMGLAGERRHEPVLLAGDFNASPDKPSLEPLRADGWTDLWGDLRPLDRGYTFEAPNPSMRIDYFWADPHARQRSKSIQVIGGKADRGSALMSDHFGLCLEIA